MVLLGSSLFKWCETGSITRGQGSGTVRDRFEIRRVKLVRDRYADQILAKESVRYAIQKNRFGVQHCETGTTV